MHEKIDTSLAEQNVNFSEVTTLQGKRILYKNFNIKKCIHPIFLVLNKHPSDYVQKDSLMVIEWGKWNDIEKIKEDLMAMVNFFSDEDFRKRIAEANDVKKWRKVLNFFKENGFSIFELGTTVTFSII